LLLIPSLGVIGAVSATTASNCLVLVVVLLLDRRLGMRVQPGTIAIAALPAVLLGGVWTAVAFVLAAISAIGQGRLFTADERQRLLEVWHECRTRITGRREHAALGPIST
jgi:hypothetical protein